MGEEQPKHEMPASPLLRQAMEGPMQRIRSAVQSAREMRKIPEGYVFSLDRMAWVPNDSGGEEA